MATVKSPVIRYHGGKFRLADWVTSHFPPHRCYVEPFGGAASVLMRKRRSEAEVYNDLDGDIVNLFRVLRSPGANAMLTEALALTPYARDEFLAAYEPTDDIVERARRTVVRAMMGFGSAGATKGGTGFRVDTRRQYGTAQDLWARFPRELSSFCKRLAGVMIENRPASEVIAQHDEPDTLFYVDPPYMFETRERAAKYNQYYNHELTDDDHIALLDQLLGVKGMVILSGYDNPLYQSKLAGWETADTTARASARRGTKVNEETIWINPAASALRRGGGLFEQAAA